MIPPHISVAGSAGGASRVRLGNLVKPRISKLWETHLLRDSAEFMNTLFRIAPLFVGLLTGPVGLGQGTFANLDFENPMFSSPPRLGSLIPIGEALPGWSGTSSLIVYNTFAIDGASISLDGPDSPGAVAFHGSYSVYLKSSVIGTDEAIWQTGQIPPSSRSLVFYARINRVLQLSFSGQPLSFVDLGSAANSYRMYAADISPFAGTTGELRFGTGRSDFRLDYIQFSSTPVPEPGTWALFGLGGALLCCARWRRGK